MVGEEQNHAGDPRSGLVEEGLLSPLIEEWRLIYLDNHAEWFRLARDVNRCGMSLYQENFEAGNGGPAQAQAPTAVRMYGRALNAFAAAVILAERAMAIEAAGAVRPIYEAGFWLSLLATDPVKALEELRVDEDAQAIARERLLREKFANDAAVVAASMVREAERQNRIGKRKPISIKAVAETIPEHSGYMEYRIVSNFYGHLSNGSLASLKAKVGDNAVINILGPHETQIPHALYFAVDAMTRTASYFAVMMKGDRALDELRSTRDRMQSLSAKVAEKEVFGGPGS